MYTQCTSRARLGQECRVISSHQEVALLIPKSRTYASKVSLHKVASVWRKWFFIWLGADVTDRYLSLKQCVARSPVK